MKLPLITAIALSAAMWQISFAQTLTSDQLAQRTIERRAVEAVNWGMSAVNYDLMLQEMFLVACVIAVFCIAGWLPGHIAKDPRSSLGRGRDDGGPGHADLRFFPLADRIDLGVCRRAAALAGAPPMIVAMLCVYLVLLFALVRF